VRIVAVEMREFRSYAHAEAHLGERLTVVHGPNGAGKSNLLEALYFGCTAGSQRTRNERELVRFGARTTRVVLQLHDGEHAHTLAVGYQAAAPAEGRAEKRVSWDGAPVERLLDSPARPLVSVFAPDRLELVKGPPGIRRAHLDQLIAALWPARAQARREYARALGQRNALLARIRAGSSRSALAAWDRELARHALELREHRNAAVALLEEPFARLAEQLGCEGGARLEYRPRSRADDEDAFVVELEQRLASDLERGFTAHGPHRDELAIARGGRELRTYGSQGEQRLALLALLLAERALLARERGRTPLMLLDDVMSELDAHRRELLAGELSSDGQSVIATTDLAHVPGACATPTARLRISPGAILQEAIAA
jgi:DNA replication and repair protein RecF